MRLVHLGLRLAAAVGLIVGATVMGLVVSQVSPAATSMHSCEPGNIEVALGRSGAGLGHWGTALLIVDPSANSCEFTGYPTVRAYVSSTKRWVAALRTPSGYLGGLQSGQRIHRVELNAYRVASFMLEGTDNPVNGATSCPTYLRVTVAFAGWPPSANLPLGAAACSLLEVHPIVYGPTGDQPPVE
jgi:hypothetical protein